MGSMVLLTAVAVLLYAIPLVFCQEICSYMIAIPRRPRPDDFPVLDFDGVPWNERPLVPPPDRDDVCMDQYIPLSATTGTQIIYMDEEIVGNVTIAQLNYDGPATPVIAQPFVSGMYTMLGPVIEKEDDHWNLIITQRQDYETPGMQVYVFNVRVAGEPLLAGVSLQIVNVDDNAPIIHVLDTCDVPELGEAGLTNCTYEVSDEDGEISTRFMTFAVDSDRGDENIFYMQGENIENEWKRMKMTVGQNVSLNFETNPLHIFRVTAFDSLPNTHTVTMMVRVQNVEHRPPRWMEIFAVQQFDEKTYQNFTVRAIDGDTDIDKPIYYRLETAEEDTFFSITTLEGGRSGAIFHVDPIDRDTLERELFQLSIIAYKYDNASFATAANVVIIVNDINDQIPEPLFEEYHIEIMEETPLTLNFAEEFGFHDRDLGQHAQYSVHLESEYPPGVAAAFYIAPQVGYQRQTFTMGTLNHSMLDYEIGEFQHIKLRVVATDLNNTDFVGVASVFIDLINWNDEEPIFEESTYTVTFDETEGQGFYVATVLAHDRDIDDRVVHSLMGNAGDYLSINESTGDIHVSIDEAFDFHRQSELYVQVRAVDTLGEPFHTATSQLVIQLNDINNTPPTLRLPRGSPHVEENVPEGYQITNEITATDPDSTAELRFEIVWETSYATKQGREADPVEFHNCVEIETLYPTNNRGSAVGRVVVREIRDNVTIDFEMFEVLYLTVRVTDINTEIGNDYDELTFTVIIVDMNDNAPQWVAGSLEQAFRVRENSATNTIIGSIVATDIDGPLYNRVRYTIVPREDTPEDLVKVGFHTGQLEVDKNGAIDADNPPRYHLHYTVVATDRCFPDDPPTEDGCPRDPTYWETEGQIAIEIIDTNNQVPYPDYGRFQVEVSIYENATTGDEVLILYSNDYDRDEIYHTVRYQINYMVNMRLRAFFDVDLDSGRVFVNYTTDEVLDRDGHEPTHQIFFNLIDNFYSQGDGNRNQNTTEVLVRLLDVNDNAPELPPPSELSWSISESMLAGERLRPDIYAPDRDEPDTDNSRVGYAILNLTLTDRSISHPDLFIMIQIQNVTGELETAVDLRGYWGTYSIEIQAFDHGIPQQISEEVYSLVIRPYNFHDPVFVFPQPAITVRLARERIVVNGLLVLVNGEFLNSISATDEDGLEAGTVTFEVIGNDNAVEYFHVTNELENEGTLLLKQTIPPDIKEFTITIQATDGGTEPRPRSAQVTFELVFVPIQEEPVFVSNTANVAFFEKEGGLSERHQLPLAEDPQNYRCVDDCRETYYRIVDGNEEGHFALDENQNILYVVKELDRNVSASHTVTVGASSSPAAGSVAATSTLTVTVTVREADPRPVFVRHLYTAGISTLDTINRELLTVQATHSENAAITYTIDMSSMVVDQTLEAVRLSAFVLQPSTGVLTLNMQPTAAMQGMFEFDVLATDPTEAYDRAHVKVYLITALNRVRFTFVNTLNQIEEQRDFISQTFGLGFGLTCNIDQIVPAADDAGLAQDQLTEVHAHFIENDVPVATEVIEVLRSDMELLGQIQTTLNTRLLVLSDFVTGISPDSDLNTAQITIYVLAAVSAVLGLLCFVLIIVFFFRNRALNNRLEGLLKTKYGSQDSGLNRAGLAAPGTNKHAVEGSNPIWNEVTKSPDFDTISEESDNSDLIGIEDLPQFRDDYFPPADANSINDIMDAGASNRVASHDNHFGFNVSPFSPEFTNKQFRR